MHVLSSWDHLKIDISLKSSFNESNYDRFIQDDSLEKEDLVTKKIDEIVNMRFWEIMMIKKYN